MELFNTLIVDPNDPEHHQKFTSLIQDNNYIVFVVMGSDDHSKELVERADLLADDHSGKVVRKVAWVPDRVLLKEDCLNYLKTFPEFEEEHYEDTVAYVLSPVWHETKYTFRTADPIDDFHVSKAYWKASLREREKPDEESEPGGNSQPDEPADPDIT